MPDTTAQPRLLAIPEVADYLGVNIRHIRRLVHERRIPFIKWGHLIRFKRSDIDAWIDENRVELGQLHRVAPIKPTSSPARSGPRRRHDHAEAPGAPSGQLPLEA